MLKVFTIIAFFALIFSSTLLVAQTKYWQFVEEDKKKNDTIYIEEFNTKFIIQPFTAGKNQRISIRDKDRENDIINYKPNLNQSIGIVASYKGIRLTLSLKFPENNEDKYGKTKFTLLQLNMKGRKYGINLYYQDYRGFYLSNPDKFDTTYFAGASFPERPDIKYTSFGFYTYYSFSKKFSVKAAFQQSERQVKSAGSFMIMLSDRLDRIYTEEDIIPNSHKNDYRDLATFKRGGFNTLLLQPGYGYTFVHDRFYFTPVVFAGGGVQFQNTFSSPGGREFNIKLIPKINFQNALGYTGDVIFARIVYEIDNLRIPFSSSTIKCYYSTWSFGLGVRF